MGRRLTRDEVLESLHTRCKERNQNHTFTVQHYNNADDSAIQVSCLEHNRSEVRTYRDYTASRLGVRCCATAAIRRVATLAKRQQACEDRVVLLANTRGHTISEARFRSKREFTFTVSCKNHHTRFEGVQYANYTSTNTTYGVPCCAYPIRVHSRKSEKEREQISNRVLRWKRQLSPSKPDRWRCPLTHLMSWGKAGAATIHGHHLYGGEGYPSLRYLVKNGVLLSQALHLEFHRTVRRPDMITPRAFLLFLEHLLDRDEHLLLCLKRLREQLQSEGWLESCTRCQDPRTGEDTYLAGVPPFHLLKRSHPLGLQPQSLRLLERSTSEAPKGGRGAYLPAWLVDEVEAGVPQVKGRVATMASDVRGRVAGLDLCLHDQALIPSNERL